MDQIGLNLENKKEKKPSNIKCYRSVSNGKRKKDLSKYVDLHDKDGE